MPFIMASRLAAQLGIAACLLIVSARIPAEEFSSKNMLACAKLGADLERLSCYDRLAATLHVDAPSKAAQDVAPTLAAPQLFGLTPNAPKPSEISNRVELKSITARIVTFRETRGNGATITLDNGQQWRQEGHEDLLLREGEKVVISRGAFASFWIVTEDNRSAHVKRLL